VQLDAIIPAIGTTNLSRPLRTTIVARLERTIGPKGQREPIEETVPVEAIIGIGDIYRCFQPDGQATLQGGPSKVMVQLRDISDGGCRVECKTGGERLTVGEAITLPVGAGGHRLGTIAWLQRRGESGAGCGIEWLLDVPHPVQVTDQGQTFAGVAGMYRAEHDRYAMVIDVADGGGVRSCVITDGESRRWAHVATVRNTGRMKTLIIDWALDGAEGGDQPSADLWSKLNVPGVRHEKEESL